LCFQLSTQQTLEFHKAPLHTLYRPPDRAVFALTDGTRVVMLRSRTEVAPTGQVEKFAFGDRTIPIHARTLGSDVHPLPTDGRVLRYGMVCSGAH